MTKRAHGNSSYIKGSLLNHANVFMKYVKSSDLLRFLIHLFIKGDPVNFRLRCMVAFKDVWFFNPKACTGSLGHFSNPSTPCWHLHGC